MNNLEPGDGGLPSARPSDNASNPLTATAKPRPQSTMMQRFNSIEDAAAAQFKTIQESKKQIDSVVREFKHLTDLQDTVTTKDVVNAGAGIVASGMPAVNMATILADMPEQPKELQAWVSKEYQQAVVGQQKVDQTVNYLRHQLLVTSFNSLIAHSAEAAALRGPVQGRA